MPDDAPREPAAARAVPLVAAVLLLGVFPFVGGKFYVDLMVTTMILAIFALSLELLVGRTGLVSFGHAAFFGIAAYATALLSPQASAPSLAWLLPAAVAISALAALGIGALSLRTRGIYFIMVTLAFAQMAYFVFHDMKFAGGSDGRYLYVKPVLAIGPYTLLDLDRPLTFYYSTLAALVAVYGLLAMLDTRGHGHVAARAFLASGVDFFVGVTAGRDGAPRITSIAELLVHPNGELEARLVSAFDPERATWSPFPVASPRLDDLVHRGLLDARVLEPRESSETFT